MLSIIYEQKDFSNHRYDFGGGLGASRGHRPGHTQHRSIDA